MTDPLIGKQLGDYVVQEILGRGGMARVYKGYDERLQRFAAVKVINNDFSTADQAEYTERFRREARAIARLHHPNIVGVYQFGDYEGNYYMAMVFIEGQDLRQILKELAESNRRMRYDDVLNIVRGIGSALDYAHSRGVIHRDIKPSNIMLDNENRAVLTDFGLALSTQEGTLGDTFGSAHYIAPEQAVSSAKAVPQSDLYSLGICLYEMLAGKVPFDDPSAMSVALKHLNEPPPPPSLYNPQLSPAIEQVIMKILDKDPNQRYTTGADFAQALERAIVADEGHTGGYIPPLAAPSSSAVRPPANANESKNDNKKNGKKNNRKDVKDSKPSQPTPLRTPLENATTVLGDAANLRLSDNTEILDRNESGEGDGKRFLNLPSQVLFIIGFLIFGALVIVATKMFNGRNIAPTPNSTLSETSVVLAATSAVNSTAIAINVTENATEVVTETATQSVAETATEIPTKTIAATDTQAVTPTATESAVLTATDPANTAISAATTSAATANVVTTTVPTGAVTATSTATHTVTKMATGAATVTPTTETATQAATQATTDSIGPVTGDNGKITLVYDNSQFVLINNTKQIVDVSKIKFVQHNSDASRTLDTSLWSSKNSQYQPYELPPHFCYQVYRNDQPEPSSLAECPVTPRNLRAAWAKVAEPRWFWIGKDGGSTTFDVLLADKTITTCEISAGKCEFSIP